MFSEAGVVLKTLTEVESLDDIQQIVDKVCKCVAEITPFDLAMLSVYFESDVYVGLEGGSEELRQRFVETAKTATHANRVAKRNEMWKHYRIPDTNIVWIPEGSALPFGPAFEPSEEMEGAEWRPADRLMVFVRGTEGDVQGVLSLDQPSDGKRPDLEDLGTLQAVDQLMTLMGAVIHNKHLAMTLRDSEERYAAVVEQGSDGLLIERDGVVLFANRRIGEMVGRDPDSMIDRPLSSVVKDDEEDDFGERTAHLIKGDGKRLAVSLRTGTIRFGGASATLVAAADVSDRQRILTQLMRAQKMESVGTLASGIAHDFNNLLSGIVGYSSLLKARLGKEDEHALRYVESIERATERAAGVTRQLLGIVRDQQVNVAPFDVAHVLEELARFLTETLDASIRVKTDCSDALPMVIGDETQIHQILLNVSLNARDAMPQGGTLTLSADGVERDGEILVRISVEDTGQGMDEATLAKVFDPFFTTKEAGRGSGLGLYMAYRIVERHGGTMDVTSEPNRGTTIEILLPGRVEQRRSATEADVVEAQQASGTVLLVDDEELVLDVCGEMLQRIGYTVITAADGREAVRAVRSAPRDLCCVVMDIAMPNMNGWEASRFIRALRPELPIVVSSGHDIGVEAGDTRGISVFGCLKKPYGLEELRAVLAEATPTASASV